MTVARRLNENGIVIWGPLLLIALVALLTYEFYPRPSVTPAWVCSKGKCDDKILLVHGEIAGIASIWVRFRLGRELDKDPSIRTVCIASSGGSSSEAMIIADNISKRGLNTCLASRYRLDAQGHKFAAGECESACTWMVLAGRERILYDGDLVMGFHGARKKTGGRADDEVEMFNERVASYTRHRPHPDDEAWQLAGLTWWAFHQGFTEVTTKCTASEVNSKYPYFTDVRSVTHLPAVSCGLQGPDEVKRFFDEEVRTAAVDLH
ncbi:MULTISPECIES: hypothetical protein [Pseudomonas]|uniref:hypothetical protein n=1 Tax=Pseudomonas TaxID=286 RepID=UPI000AF48DCC|nr:MULTISPECIES: hypothetical protein [Pseudomonas]MCE0782288.1 hypothetical protein [Pseudomonas sp. NMI542_15]